MRWILAVLGYMVYRFPGAIVGFLIGMFIESLRGGTSSTFNWNSETSTRAKVSPADFELNLLSLCSVVIKSNGQISQTELDFVQQKFVEMYGKERANATFRTFNDLVKGREISPERIALFLRMRTPYEVRLQILHFLFGIAKADGQVTQPEINIIQSIAGYFGIYTSDFESIKAMFVQSQSKISNAYTILEIDKNATDAEVKKAYRNMAKKYHPDSVVTKDEAIKKGAEEKFKQVQLAYEEIMNSRK